MKLILIGFTLILLKIEIIQFIQAGSFIDIIAVAGFFLVLVGFTNKPSPSKKTDATDVPESIDGSKE